MMKRIMKKLSEKRGESLLEVLFAILIFTFASITMYTMVMSGMTITKKARMTDEINQAQMIVAERAEGEGKPASVSVTLTETPAGGVSQKLDEVNVKIFGKDGELYAYYVDGFVHEEGGT